MVSRVRYATYPQVEMDPAVLVPDWSLSTVGRDRVTALAAAEWLSDHIADHCHRRNAKPSKRPRSQPQPWVSASRSATPCTKTIGRRRSSCHLRKFDVVFDAFRNPKISMRGWEPAVYAQAQIVREMEAVLDRAPQGQVLVVGHGAVGTLLLCHYRKIPISRAHDQPVGGRRYFTVLRGDRRVLEKPPFALAIRTVSPARVLALIRSGALLPSILWRLSNGRNAHAWYPRISGSTLDLAYAHALV